ncbi:uncharacterized protein N7529_002905 [Penicillium soppii]|uniref:uncharacterized protein n=1 Tax=Penicillium soppii TaxID=69789 RepID=UPI002547BD31|nr:uncharacterized protein N7529_002905 [Penicillium soppii]KAJ5874475.1 hypothetical protein N7529_002905 [Penicillium soppii]
MSVNEKRHSQHTSTPRAVSSSESDREALDQRLQRLSDEILPRFLIFSRHDRPFRLEEQQLQYMTFLAHRDSDSLLVAVGDWSDETGRMMADRSTVPNTTESSRDTVAKKKISLKDYKDQKTTGAAASPMGPDAGGRDAPGSTKSEEKRQTTSSDPPKTVHGAESSPIPPKSHTRLSPKRAGQKRPSGSEREFLNAKGTKDLEAHSLKKPRLSPEKEPRRAPSPLKSHSPKLPALLSPTLPPISTGPRLPRLLSPTLPPDIEKELAALENAPQSRNNRPNIAEKALPVKEPSRREDTSDNTRAHPPKTQLITRLRYGRANRKRVEALLKFNGKRQSQRSDSPISQDADRDDLSRHKKKAADTGSSRLGGPKYKKQETDEPISSQEGRKKESKSLPEKPQTPVPQSSSVSHTAAHEKSKTSSITPVKDLKSSSRRNDLAESDRKPSSHPINKRHSVDPGSTSKGPPTQPDGRMHNDIQTWLQEWQKFAGLGRELKHAAERYTNRSGAPGNTEKLAAVTAIEALLSFILAFVANDQVRLLKRQVADSTSWLSIVAYWRVVKKNSAPFPALSNLCSLLGAVSYSTIHALDLERLASIPIPGDHTPAPTPGSDGNAVVPDEKKTRKDFSDLKNRLPDTYRDSQRFWLEGTRGLSEDVLEREFPTSWSQRSREYSERGRRSSLKAGDYSGAYFLPFSGFTPPIEVVRFSWSLLKEWCSKEQVEWNGRLGL